MSVKPTTLPTWATDTNYTGGVEAGTPTKVAPTAGRQAEGWEPAAKPPAQEFNWWKNLVYLWTLFLNQFFTDGGGATGNLDVGVTAEANLVPLVKHRDYLTKIRSTVDHNGYRMGQVSEIDEHWAVSPINTDLPLLAGNVVSGGWTWAGGSWNTASAGTLKFDTSPFVPKNCLVTEIRVLYQRSNAGDSTTLQFEEGLQTGSVSFLDTTSVGSQDVNIMASATSGHGPLQHGDSANSPFANFFRITATTVGANQQISLVRFTYLPAAPGWSWTQATTNTPASSTTGDSMVQVVPGAGFNQRGIRLIGKAVSGVAGSSVMTRGTPDTVIFETYHDANCAYVLEFTLKTGTITDGTNKRLFAHGIQNNNAGGLNRFVYFYTDETFANWQLRVVGSSTANTDTGIAVAANTVYRMRLEIYGSAVNSSGNTKIRAYINGALVAEVNSTTLPTADMIRPYFEVGTNGTTGGPYDCTIGRVRRVWNHLLTPDNL